MRECCRMYEEVGKKSMQTLSLCCNIFFICIMSLISLVTSEIIFSFIFYKLILLVTFARSWHAIWIGKKSVKCNPLKIHTPTKLSHCQSRELRLTVANFFNKFAYNLPVVLLLKWDIIITVQTPVVLKFSFSPSTT